MPVTDPRAERVASIALFAGASVWGLYWVPLRTMTSMGIDGAWGVVYFNACPLIVLVPVMIWGRSQMLARPGPVLFIGAATGLGMGFYSSAIVMAPIIRMTMEFYLTPLWSTIIGVLWLSERLDSRRVVTVLAGLAGLGLLLVGVPGDPMASFGLGDGLALTSGILWAFGAAGMKRWPDVNRPGFTGGQNSRRIAHYGTDIKEENREAVFTRVPRARGAAGDGTPR